MLNRLTKLLFINLDDIFELYLIDINRFKILQKSILYSKLIHLILSNNKRYVLDVNFLISNTIIMITIFYAAT
jgi:hypothetical protein